MRLVNELVCERTRLLAMLDNTDALIWAVDPELRLPSANATFQPAQRGTSGRDLQVGDSVVGPEFSDVARARWSAYYRRASRATSWRASSWRTVRLSRSC
jgi:hypothetical protein